mmetsp:Transcript_5122/g.9644  ORF Transcript_5122/g.9644 Transcript_5122/m.9644 type:complete len:91 (+) Transcript_5122:667-939(+)
MMPAKKKRVRTLWKIPGTRPGSCMYLYGLCGKTLVCSMCTTKRGGVTCTRERSAVLWKIPTMTEEGKNKEMWDEYSRFFPELYCGSLFPD